ncbi:MAG: DUF4386 domain-containing protein [Candidatus Schekmanbacteria bacterium]|nr:DUF4386 domain-containing protein [Candidatus Schekmanbacteria bacterium]
MLLLISLVAGGFGELYVPTTVTVPNDAAATARNIDSSNLLFRMGFAAYLVEGLCNIALTLIFYVLLRPVRKDMALLAAFFGLVAVAVFAVAELFYLAPLLIFESRNSLNAFSNDQLDAIALLSLKFYGYASGALMAFGGVGSIIFGCLIFLSGYLPRILGALLALGGLGFVIRNFALVLAPAPAYDWLFLPMSLGMLGLGIWLLIFGGEVDSMEGRAR